jgi:hypothetical protein
MNCTSSRCLAVVARSAFAIAPVLCAASRPPALSHLVQSLILMVHDLLNAGESVDNVFRLLFAKQAIST